MALRYPDRLESNNPSAYGIVPASQISGHRTVANLTALYALKDCILSESGNNTANDALGQEWYVVSEQANYRLTDWANRTKAAGWQKVIDGGDIDLSDYVTKDNVVTSVWIDQSESNRIDVCASYGDGSDGDGNFINAATTTVAGVMSAEDKDTLDHLANLARISGNGGILVAGEQGVTADNNGSNVTIDLPCVTDSGDGWDNGDLNITIPAATADDAGVMTAEDKAKLDGLKNYTLPTATDSALGGVMTGYTETDNNFALKLDANKGYVTVPDATTSKSGLLSGGDKTRLDELRQHLLDNKKAETLPSDILCTPPEITQQSSVVTLDFNGVYSSPTDGYKTATLEQLRLEAASADQAGVMTTTMFNKLNGVADEATADSPISEIDINRICV